jgi:putative redox protein
METNSKIQASIGLEPYATRISMRGHLITGDETIENGGKDKGPTPTELVLSGLASCTTATLKMYADRKKWPLERVNVEMGIHIERNADGSQVSHIMRILHFEGDLTEEQKERLIQIAEKCPVHRLLTNEIQIKTGINIE